MYAKFHRLCLATSAALLLAMMVCPAEAQQGLPLPPVSGAPAAAAPQKSPPPAKGKQPAASATTATQPKAGEGGLARRVDELEQQLVDMQVVIGTLESLARSGGGTPGPTASASPAFRPSAQPSAGAYSSSDAARIDGLETQIRALTAQIEQLAEQVRAMGGRRTEAPGLPGPAVLSQGGPAPAPASRFGKTTVTSVEPPPSLPPAGAPAQAEEGAGARQIYETAYNHLLQQDYGAAEAGFEDFLRRYPKDALSPNAQYWLGETHFVRGQYKQAAEAFLKGYRSYARSNKAPDSLLKLAMSLERLGQRDAACSSFAELGTRFPNAPTQIKSRAQSERQRIGCA